MGEYKPLELTEYFANNISQELLNVLKLSYKSSCLFGRTLVETNDLIAGIIIHEECEAHKLIYSMTNNINHDMSEIHIESAKENYETVRIQDIRLNPHSEEAFEIAFHENFLFGNTSNKIKLKSDLLLLSLLSRPYFKSFVLFSNSNVSYSNLKSIIYNQNSIIERFDDFTRPISLGKYPVYKLLNMCHLI